MKEHILICTGSYNLFKYLCVLRAARFCHEYRSIVILCERPPTDEEHALLAKFPALTYIIGNPTKKRDLLRAGIVGAWKGGY
jgi:hypothetical protein